MIRLLVTRALALPLALLALTAAVHPALAQLAHHPFAVGAAEGAVGRQTMLGAWLIGMESRFYLGLTHAVRLTEASPGGLFALIGLSFAYGVFHAAGPGHGKAVVTSYLVSNEVALRRGLAVALAAALLQALVATAIVGIAALVFDATAPTMTAAAQAIELASYIGIVGLGLVLVWRKGRALATALPRRRRYVEPAPLAGFAFAPAGAASLYVGGETADAPSTIGRASLRFVADGGAGHVHDARCLCGHIPSPETLADPRFDWKAAALAVVTAGARPCSGAILVLVFALAQGMLAAGVAATFAMALGTAVTTGALAAFAVLAKDAALRVAGTSAPRAALIGRGLELAAALAVLGFGLLLLAAALAGAHGAA
ncbi:MAG: high frequency lysogenization protein HflD [Caulobacteraceae bacterium]|nr:high frequency lysogenization protein HflD [Caulobacter sp.]